MEKVNELFHWNTSMELFFERIKNSSLLMHDSLVTPPPPLPPPPFTYRTEHHPFQIIMTAILT